MGKPTTRASYIAALEQRVSKAEIIFQDIKREIIGKVPSLPHQISTDIVAWLKDLEAEEN